MKKHLAYSKEEVNGTVTVIFHPLHVITMYILIAFYISSVFVPDDIAYIKWKIWLSFIGVAGLIIYLIYNLIVVLPINKEIKEKAKAGNVTVSGSKLSFSNPLTYTYKK